MSRLLAIVAVFIALLTPAYADRGLVPLIPSAIEEPGQNVIVAWNGEEEVLVLSTTVKASRNTTVLEILPLPSEPEIKMGDEEMFKALTEIANRKIIKSGLARSTGVHVVLKAKLGPHNITVVRAESSDELVEFIRSYIDQIGPYSKLHNLDYHINQTILQDYISRGYGYFVLDTIKVGGSKDIVPIIYRFSTDKLYYPLKITSTLNSTTFIRMFILAPGIVEGIEKFRLHPLDMKRYVYISKDELRNVNSTIAELFENGAFLIYAEGWGFARVFDRDVEIDGFRYPTIAEHLHTIFAGTMLELIIDAFFEMEPFLIPVTVVPVMLGIIGISFLILNFREQFGVLAIFLAVITPAVLLIMPESIAMLAVIPLYALGAIFFVYVVIKVAVWLSERPRA